jgi:TrmH family RNA methyltransferase
MDIIKSKDNSKIRYVRSLSSKKGRDEKNAFIVEGVKFVNEAIYENAHIISLIFNENTLNKTNAREIYDFALKSEIEIVTCEENVFKTVADTISSQGVLAVIEMKKNFSTINDFKFAIMCDRIQDPGNLGTIIRTADAFGPAAVILNKGCVDEYNPKVVRASAGAIFRVPFIHSDIDKEMISKLKESGYAIISTVVDSEYSFEDIDMYEKICLVIGNEGQGVSQEISECSHMNITIKMSGRSESLNASIAAGISIYEIRKKLL